MTSKINSYQWLWLSLALMVILFIAFLLPLVPNDYWWFVRLGNDILENGSVPTMDTYSYTQFGRPVVYQSWFSALLFALIYEYGGISLTFLIRALLLGVTYSLLWKVAMDMGAGPRLATGLTLISALAGSNNWSHRPQLFVYVLFVWMLSLLWNWHQGKDKGIWWVVLISLLWANLHGSFVLLFALASGTLIFGDGNRKKLSIVLVLAGLVTLVNPRGLALWNSVLETFLIPGSRNMSVEWAPPVNAGWQMGIFFLWLLCFAPMVALSSRRLPNFSWVWFLGFGWLALSGMRYVIWFLFILVPVSAYLLTDWSESCLDRPIVLGRPAMNVTLGFFFVLLPLITMPGVRDLWWQDAPSPLSDGTPVEAIEWLSQHDTLPGEMWSDIHFASYQIYALPSRPVWIDTRIQVVYPPVLFEEYRAIAGADVNWQELIEEYHVNLLLLSPVSQARLVSTLDKSHDWCDLYEDVVALIYVRIQDDGSCPQ
jgi:hypothetical protein